MNSDSRNAQLRKLYMEQWPVLREILLSDDELSAPYLAVVHPGYEMAEIRLVVVGKETSGWGDRGAMINQTASGAVDALMGQYRQFALGTRYSGKQSFWTPVHELYRLLNPGGPSLGFVALNASKVDRRGSTPPKRIREMQIQTRLLPEEMRILQPDVVVFHTGPRYEEMLEAWFPGLIQIGDNWLAELTANNLPGTAFRTYHPRYLNFQSRRQSVYAEIVARLRGAGPTTAPGA